MLRFLPGEMDQSPVAALEIRAEPAGFHRRCYPNAGVRASLPQSKSGWSYFSPSGGFAKPASQRPPFPSTGQPGSPGSSASLHWGRENGLDREGKTIREGSGYYVELNWTGTGFLGSSISRLGGRISRFGEPSAIPLCSRLRPARPGDRPQQVVFESARAAVGHRPLSGQAESVCKMGSTAERGFSRTIDVRNVFGRRTGEVPRRTVEA